jgi:phosphohistidine phosphatase
MEIYFLRHANAGQSQLNPRKDEQRALDELGIRQSHDVGRALKALKITVDAIISSPLPRAAETATIAAEEIGHEDKIILDEAMRPESTYDQFEQLLERYRSQDAIMIVGHNPSMTEFLNKLVTGHTSPHNIELKKGAVVKVEKDGRSAVLKWCLTPKIVRAIQEASASSSRPKAVSK